MTNTTLNPELPERDRLMTRPDEKPLPTTQDPKAPAAAADPRPTPPEDGQGTDPKAGALDHTA